MGKWFRRAVDPLGHLGRGATLKRHQQDPSGVGPCTIRWATRWARVLVFPDPAPAMTSSGVATNPPAAPCSAARRCLGIEGFEVGGFPLAIQRKVQSPTEPLRLKPPNLQLV